MKKVLLSAAAIIAVATGFAQTTWKSDKMHSQLKFDITHLMVSTVSGSFTDFDASIVSSKPDFSDAVYTLTAKAASINTGEAPRDTHLKSADFFDVATFTTVTFKSTKIEKIAGDGKYKVTGNLTMHGVTKAETLNLWYRGTTQNPMSKKTLAGFKVTGTLNRNDFNLGTKYPSAMLSNDVDIAAEGEFSTAE